MTGYNRIPSHNPLHAFSKVSRILSNRQGAISGPQIPGMKPDRFQNSLPQKGSLQTPEQLFASKPGTVFSAPPIESPAPSRSLRPLSRPESSTSSGQVRDTGQKDYAGRAVRLTPEAHEGLLEIQKIAQSKGIQVKINSSHRSIERQRELFDQAVKKYGSVRKARKWVAPPGKSRHNYGNAIDLNLLRNGRKIPQREFDRIIAEAGMYRPMSWETWHIEPLSTKQSRGQA